MAFQITWSPESIGDLGEIFAYIAADNLDATVTLHQRIESLFRDLLTFLTPVTSLPSFPIKPDIGS